MASVKLKKAVINLGNALLIVIFLTACGGGTKSILGTDTAPSEPIAVATLNAAPANACPSSGITIDSGIDKNSNKILESSEVTSTQYVCNGTSGLDSFTTLLAVTNEPLGNNCATGGNLISVGIDSNRTGILDNSEITSFSYICNGTVGANGVNGTNGLNTLSKTVIELAGQNCIYAGLKSMSGADVNANANLDSNEVMSTTYVCNGANGTNGIDGLNTLVAVIAEPIGQYCAYGGTKSTSGLDANINGVLNPIEVVSTAYVCNGFNGTNGTNGLSSLTVNVAESASLNCTNGGIKQTTGIDTDANGILNPSEVTSTTYVCNGASGLNGTDGSNGTNGLNTLLAIAIEPAGLNCSFGGSKTEAGLDTNANGVLGVIEVTTTTYVCNGINGTIGSSGVNSLTALVLEPVGINCLNGGSKATSGIDANTNQVLDSSEVTSTTYVCNGTNGLNTLAQANAEPAGLNCASGGSKTNTGLDTNVNSVLDALEVTSTTYVCNGINGSSGLNGTNGVNGLSALVTTIAEPSGVNCSYGGSKATSGLDTDANGVLSAPEVTSTTYVCNGTNGLNGTNGSNGLNSLIAITTESVGVNCLYGGSKATSGLDINSNNILESNEITSTTFICSGATGSTGATGPSGGGLSSYAYIYNVSAQTVPIQSAVMFDSNGVLYGVTHALGSASFRVIGSGAYNVAFSISGAEPSQFALFVNGVVAPGSIYGSGAGTQQNNGQITLMLAAGDSLTIVNYSSAAAVTLPSFTGGSQANVNASVSIQKLN